MANSEDKSDLKSPFFLTQDEDVKKKNKMEQKRKTFIDLSQRGRRASGRKGKPSEFGTSFSSHLCVYCLFVVRRPVNENDESELPTLSFCCVFAETNHSLRLLLCAGGDGVYSVASSEADWQLIVVLEDAY
jgi:hypothetical protein